MRHLTLRLAVALLTFVVGTAISQVRVLLPAKWEQAQSEAPLRLYPVNKDTDGFNHQTTFAVKNTSNKTVVAYALGHSGAGGYGYLLGRPLEQSLRTGEVQYQNIPSRLAGKVWVDFVRFSDGSTWGSDESESVGYTAEWPFESK
jgi:hypothetical protein